MSLPSTSCGKSAAWPPISRKFFAPASASPRASPPALAADGEDIEITAFATQRRWNKTAGQATADCGADRVWATR
jgi:hypothetical protein